MTDGETYQSYIFMITDWAVDYGFSIGTRHDPPTPYWDHLALKLTTMGVFLERIEGRSFQFYFIADRDWILRWRRRSRFTTRRSVSES